MSSLTTNYSLIKPGVADPTDEDLWGGYLNDDMDIIDGQLYLTKGNPVITKTSNYTVLTTDKGKTILCDATVGGFTVSLPAAATAGDGFFFYAKKTDASTNVVTIDPNGSETVDGAITATLTTQYQINAYVCDGSAWYLVNKSYVPTPNTYMHVRDEKTAGTGGGSFTSGAWQTRTLQTTKINTISGASLASNQITLPAGTYKINFQAVAAQVQRHQTRFYNTTDAIAYYGLNNRVSDSVGTGDASGGYCYVVITGTKVFELQHRCESTDGTDGYGDPNSFGGVEVYSDVFIEKLNG